MLTPILMLLLMTTPWLIHRLRGGSRGGNGELDARAIGAGMLFLLTSSAHFFQIGPMSAMLPEAVPQREALVVLSGVLEVAIALGFFLPACRRTAALVAIVVLVGFFPLNVYSAIHHVPFGGHAWGPVYLLIRLPLQLAIIGWVYRILRLMEASRVGSPMNAQRAAASLPSA